MYNWEDLLAFLTGRRVSVKIWWHLLISPPIGQLISPVLAWTDIIRASYWGFLWRFLLQFLCEFHLFNKLLVKWSPLAGNVRVSFSVALESLYRGPLKFILTFQPINRVISPRWQCQCFMGGLFGAPVLESLWDFHLLAKRSHQRLAISLSLHQPALQNILVVNIKK